MSPSSHRRLLQEAMTRVTMKHRVAQARHAERVAAAFESLSDVMREVSAEAKALQQSAVPTRH
jgi:hypothetical protein